MDVVFGELITKTLALQTPDRTSLWLATPLVCNAAGKILGLISLEDVLEQIIGDLQDEHDHPLRKVSLRSKRQQLAPKRNAKRPRP